MQKIKVVILSGVTHSFIVSHAVEGPRSRSHHPYSSNLSPTNSPGAPSIAYFAIGVPGELAHWGEDGWDACIKTQKSPAHSRAFPFNNRQPSTYVVMSTPRQNATWCFTLRAAGFGSG